MVKAIGSSGRWAGVILAWCLICPWLVDLAERVLGVWVGQGVSGTVIWALEATGGLLWLAGMGAIGWAMVIRWRVKRRVRKVVAIVRVDSGLEN